MENLNLEELRSMLDSGFQPNENSSPVESYKNFKLKQPDLKKGETSTVSIYKIFAALPAWKDKKAWVKDRVTGKLSPVNWAFTHRKHCGYKVADPSDLAQITWKAFVCPRKVKDRVEITPCAECAKIWDAKQRLLALKSEYKGRENELEALESYRKDVEYLNAYWLDDKWKVLVMNMQGDVGVLSLSKTTLQDKLYPLLTKNPQNNYWVKFTSTGNGRDKVDECEIYSRNEEVTVGGRTMTVPVPVECVLTDEQLAKVFHLAPDISTVLGADTLTHSQIEEISKSSGDPTELWHIFNRKTEAPPSSEMTVDKFKAQFGA